jgi:periplasmic protein CpxP/Spy
MNKTFLRSTMSAVLAAGLTLCSGAAIAQDSSTTPQQPQAPGGGEGMHRHGMSPDEALARMTKRYNLSADQQSQIKPILQDQQQQMEALRSDTTTSRDDKMAKAKSIREASNTKIESVLNDQQKQQYEQDMQKRAEHMHGGGGAPPQQ